MAHPAGTEIEDQQFAKSLGVGDDHIVVVPTGVQACKRRRPCCS